MTLRNFSCEGVEFLFFLTSSLGHPKIFVKEFFNGFVPFHDHCPGEKLSFEKPVLCRSSSLSASKYRVVTS